MGSNGGLSGPNKQFDRFTVCIDQAWPLVLGAEELVVKDGKMKVPAVPGLGINPQPEVMNKILENGKWE
jgi:L-alanine-DL-glutamate epimerase-like enolase superfamily enzyme